MSPAPAERLIAIGASTGGVTALRQLLSGLRADLEWPVVIVLHIRDPDISNLLQLLASSTALKVSEALAGAPVAPRCVYVAPGDYHLLIEADHRFALSVDEHVCFARPSVDVLFSSVADAYGAGAIGVILTGANDDGAEGIVQILQHGGMAIVQQPQEAEATEMPAAALQRSAIDAVLPLTGIALRINEEFERCQA